MYMWDMHTTRKKNTETARGLKVKCLGNSLAALASASEVVVGQAPMKIS